MPSSIPVAKQSILALLSAASWPTRSPDVRWGGPTNVEDYSLNGEMVYFAETIDIAKEYLTLGGERVDESYTLRIFVDVAGYGDYEQDTEIRAFELADTVESVLHDNHNLIHEPGVRTVRLVNRSARQANVPLPEQWLVRIIIDQEADGEIYNP